MKVRIPTPLRSYTAEASVVEADGHTIGAVLEDLDRRFPGLRFRVVAQWWILHTPVKPATEVGMPA